MKEFELIDNIRKRAGKPGKGVRLGIGDDCAVLDYDNKHYLLWGIDSIIEGTHFRLKGTPYSKIGWKAVAVNISDIAAMGGLPKYILVSIALPPYVKSSAIRDIYDGILNICNSYNIKLIGGDTNKSQRLVIDVSIIGVVEKENLIARSGAKKGELILITGPVRNGRKEHLYFKPRLEEARYLVQNYKISSMIDVSDGISMDLARICSSSNVGAELYRDSIPLSSGLSLDDALHYGESFELMFTMGMPEAVRLFKSFGRRNKRCPYFVIGNIVRKEKSLRLVDKFGHRKALKVAGFEHL